MRRYGLWAFLLATMLQTGGCATALTLGAIDPGEEEDKFDYVNGITAAWRDEAGNVTLCVTGRPAGGNYWLGGTRNYSISYPGASSPAVKVSYHETIPQYRVTAADVGGGCQKNMGDMTPLPVLRVHAREFGGGGYFEMSDKALAEFLENRAEAPAVYMFDYRSGGEEYGSDLSNVVYVHEAPPHGNPRAIEIATDMRKVEGRPAYALLLPFAVAFDIVMFPVQLAAALMHAG